MKGLCSRCNKSFELVSGAECPICESTLSFAVKTPKPKPKAKAKTAPKKKIT